MDRYCVKEGLIYPKQSVEIATGRPLPFRFVKIVDQYKDETIHQIVLIEPDMWATEVYEQCAKLNQEHRAYHKTLFQFLYVSAE